MSVFRWRAQERTMVEAKPDPGALNAETDDAVLVAAARVNHEAFTLLYRRYLQSVHRYCYLRLGSREAAEDATSEVFLKALSNLEGYRGGAFGGWLFRIAHNVIADHHRARQHRIVVPLAAADSLQDLTAQPETSAIRQSEVAILRHALSTLTPDQRTLLELQLAGFSNHEIAAALGRSPGALRALRFRAHEALRSVLDDAVWDDDDHASRANTQTGGVPC